MYKILLYFSILICLVQPKFVVQNPESAELITRLTSLYCTAKGAKAICNEPEAKMCSDKNVCNINVCSQESRKECECPGCAVCCTANGASGACFPSNYFGLTRAGGSPWFYRDKRSEQEGQCAPQDDSDICPHGSDGKVCAAVFFPNMPSGVEMPFTCQQRQCQRVLCKYMGIPGTDSAVATCVCSGVYARYPVCCLTSSGSCEPYQVLLQSRASQYLNRIENNGAPPLIVTQPAPVFPNQVTPATTSWRTVFRPNSVAPVNTSPAIVVVPVPSIRCADAQNENMLCGRYKICRNRACQHVCGNEVYECHCDPGSSEECHLCCILGGKCSSVVKRYRNPSYSRIEGTSCNFTRGICESGGVCQPAANYPETGFCAAKDTENKVCGPKSYCSNSKCVFACGDPGNDCVCRPGGLDECHECCKDIDGQCKPITNLSTGKGLFMPQLLRFKPVNTMCNYSFGLCGNGQCEPIKDRPGSSPCSRKPDGASCGERYICRSEKCEHICGLPQKACQCNQGDVDECHICCINDVGICQSILDPGKPNAELYHKSVGTQCNFTFGLCSNEGKCEMAKGHPGIAMCEKPETDRLPCGIREQWCKGQKCVHVCSHSQLACSCSSSGPDQCKQCCIIDGKCQPFKVPESAGPSTRRLQFMSAGVACNFSFGVCDSTGSCTPVADRPGLSFCKYYKNDAAVCGERSYCQNGECKHICGSPLNECECPQGSKYECYRCCVLNGTCNAAANSSNQFGAKLGSLYLKSFGSPCNFTDGTCDRRGVCKRLDQHPNREMCQKSDMELQVCAEKSWCKNGACTHICGDSTRECECAPTSTECHRCCLKMNSELNTTECLSMYDPVYGSHFAVLRKPIGTLCNYTLGVCQQNGSCNVREKHPGLSFCQVPKNDGTPCADKMVCKHGYCQSICGSPLMECECIQGGHQECHRCCLMDGVCKSLIDISNTVSGKPKSIYVKSLNAPCNFTYGSCNREGVCIRRVDHPGLQFCARDINEGKPCNEHSICKSNQCSHICGSFQNQCNCRSGSVDECHVCCLTSGECRSTIESMPKFRINLTASVWVKGMGTPCNSSLGECSKNGTCVAQNDRPGLLYCQRMGNQGATCALGKTCQNGDCISICGSSELQCECNPGASFECHYCCIVDGICQSFTNQTSQNDVRANTLEINYKPEGHPCNFSFGTCNKQGKCEALNVHPLYNKCNYANNDGISCGEDMICRNRKCEHLCTSYENKCSCQSGSIHECHICCLQNGRCKSSLQIDVQDGNISSNLSIWIKDVGIPCNYSYGQCSKTGSCESVNNRPGLLFCQQFGNELKTCELGKICQNGECVNICGSPSLQCECDQGHPDECHLCCLIDNICQSFDSLTNNDLNSTLLQINYKPEGHPCNFSFGTCNKQGKCEALNVHPLYNKCNYLINDGISCGEDMICRNRKCEHLCTSYENKCSCQSGSIHECHICCLQNGRCKSSLQIDVQDGNISSNLSIWIKDVGVPCNYSYGQCSKTGSCESVINRPGLLFCQKDENDLKTCEFGKICQDGECLSICGSPNLLCECDQGHPDECRLCCIVDNTCQPYYNLSNNNTTEVVNRMFIKPEGTACNFDYGTCNRQGKCQAVENNPLLGKCHNIKNNGSICGENDDRICLNKTCQHVCGSPRLRCQCSFESGTECHICCINEDRCESASIRLSKIFPSDPPTARRWSYTYKLPGTNCRYTLGTCDTQGQCVNRTSHPSYSFCQSKNTPDGKECGRAKMCSAGKCVHVCGSDVNQCLCATASPQDCHVCCKDPLSGLCVSARDRLNKPFLLRESGSPCNFTLGACSAKGECSINKKNPLTATCDFPDRQGKPCGDEINFSCIEYKCQHVCGTRSDICKCASTEEACHVCCKKGGICQSVHSKFQLVRPTGDDCGQGGTCSKDGTCEASDQFCINPSNKGRQCGRERHCNAKNRCTHVCGTEATKCFCGSNPGGINDCNVCCLDTSAENAVSGGDTCKPKIDLLNPLILKADGSPCNDTKSICTIDGKCIPSDVYYRGDNTSVRITDSKLIFMFCVMFLYVG